MAEDTKQPDTDASKPADVSDQSTAGEAQAAVTADSEKNSRVEDAKARVAAAKEALTEKAAAVPTTGAPAAPKAPVKKKEEGPKPVDASTHPLVKRLQETFGESVIEATAFLGQLSIRIARPSIVEVCEGLKADSETPFNYLSDLTCVHYPDNREAPFEVVYNLYSISKNERVRLKVNTNGEGVESVTRVWPVADWLEREVYDLFGVVFHNHPDLRRILLPPDWDGHPLRKDYPLEFIENRWTEEHLPGFTDVQREQVEQRRTYGLEMLSVPQEREVRKLFIADKEVMPKDK